eukprot:scaffold80139_cov33-Tisochrysis_lutea.AAC.3
MGLHHQSRATQLQRRDCSPPHDGEASTPTHQVPLCSPRAQVEVRERGCAGMLGRSNGMHVSSMREVSTRAGRVPAGRMVGVNGMQS